jgi:hypothetical protein
MNKELLGYHPLSSRSVKELASSISCKNILETEKPQYLVAEEGAGGFLPPHMGPSWKNRVSAKILPQETLAYITI